MEKLLLNKSNAEQRAVNPRQLARVRKIFSIWHSMKVDIVRRDQEGSKEQAQLQPRISFLHTHLPLAETHNSKSHRKDLGEQLYSWWPMKSSFFILNEANSVD